MSEINVVVPVFNEAGNIVALSKEITSALGGETFELPIVNTVHGFLENQNITI